MNKQEAIEKIKSEKKLGGINSYGLGYNEALDEAIYIVKQLDEPEKPVVPQFVADWYEDNKDDFEYNLYRLCIDFYGRKLYGDLYEWFKFDKNKPIETLILMHKFGYEVKKEKLYTVEIPNPNDFVHTILHRTEKGIIISYSTDENYKNIKQNQLTEAEIKQDFEWAWQFAEKVEE